MNEKEEFRLPKYLEETSKNDMSNSVNFGVQNSIGTPPTNRGVGCPPDDTFSLIKQGNCSFILFDWFQCTILDESFDSFVDTGEVFGVRDIRRVVVQLFKEFFNLDPEDLVFEYSGINGYNASYYYKNIYIMYNVNRPDMGIHIKMSGQGCRDFEELNLDYFEFFRKLEAHLVNYNRIDISIDDFTDKYFTLQKLIDKVRVGELTSKFLDCINIEKVGLVDFKNKGHTLQFGSKASNIQITFYDKLKERQSKNIIVDHDLKFWTRTEVRFRHKYARNVIKLILGGENTVNDVVRSVLSQYISFKSPTGSSRMRRRGEADWWSAFLGNITTLSITNYLPESSITKKKDWLFKSTSKSNLIVFLSSLDNLELDDKSSDYLLELFKKGIEKFDYKDLKLINDYRIQNKLVPLSKYEVEAYINDLHSIILSSD